MFEEYMEEGICPWIMWCYSDTSIYSGQNSFWHNVNIFGMCVFYLLIKHSLYPCKSISKLFLIRHGMFWLFLKPFSEWVTHLYLLSAGTLKAVELS